MVAGDPANSIGSGRQQRALVLGGTGMLGHKLVQRMAARGIWVAATIRDASLAKTKAAAYALRDAALVLDTMDVLRDDAVAAAIARAEPDVVVNAVGVIKQLDAAKDPIPSITTNSLLPHRLAALCRHSGTRLVHFSTDCVFAGRHGPFSED